MAVAAIVTLLTPAPIVLLAPIILLTPIALHSPTLLSLISRLAGPPNGPPDRPPGRPPARLEVEISLYRIFSVRNKIIQRFLFVLKNLRQFLLLLSLILIP